MDHIEDHFWSIFGDEIRGCSLFKHGRVTLNYKYPNIIVHQGR